jgi:indolepyruvate ferredoxin oxidoreductase alpha subunit
MKHVGLNVAADAFMTTAYTGVKGGLVVVTADDPSCHSSQNEQDNRLYGRLAGIPVFEPSSPNEAKEMARMAFDISEELELPIMLRTTTRTSHMRGPVTLGPMREKRGKGHFVKEPTRWITIPVHARKRHALLLRQMEKAEQISENIEFNKTIDLGGREIGVISSGAAFNYSIDFMKEQKVNGKILKLGMTNPIPRKKCLDFMKSVDKVLISEELEPLLEEKLKALAYDEGLEIRIYGKQTGHFSRLYEYTPDTVKEGMSKLLNIKVEDRKLEPVEIYLPPRPPDLCPGCPHRHVYYAAKKALGKEFDETIFATDIGCYSLVIQPPLRMADFLLCMGSSVDSSGGFSQATDQHVFAHIGDSTFFHSGIHGLINAVYNRHKFVLTVLDNRTTAMTGHQPNPGTGKSGMGEESPIISIEAIVKGCGVDFVRTVDPNNLKKTIEVYKEAVEHDGISTILAVRPCALLAVREKKANGTYRPYQIDQDKCTKCRICTDKFACPAIFVDLEGSVTINKTFCAGCGMCHQVCPVGATGPVEVSP